MEKMTVGVGLVALETLAAGMEARACAEAEGLAKTFFIRQESIETNFHLRRRRQPQTWIWHRNG